MDKIKILVPLDGSEASENVISYIEEVFPPDKSDIALFHVSPEIPQDYWEMGKNIAVNPQKYAAKAWAREKHKEIKSFLENAKARLIRKGFDKENIHVKIQPKKVGIARDILHESQQGYQIIAIGRTGISKLKDMVLGSTAEKLLGKVKIPIAIIGKKGNYQNFLIAYDGSEDANKAVDCTGSLMGSTRCNFRLCNVIRPLNIMYLNELQSTFPLNDVQWMEDNKKKIEPLIDAAVKKMVSYGVPQNHVSKKILTDSVSRSNGILEEATEGNFGTVVVGRRDLSFLEEFFQGRVGKKIYQMAENQAVWVVS